AAAGWECVGVDISTAAIEHARRNVPGEFVCGDFARAAVEGTFDLVLCLFGEISTIGVDAGRVVVAHRAARLRENGRIVVECSTRLGVRNKGQRPPTWYRGAGGLFAEGPHVVLLESRWFPEAAASVERWWVIADAETEPRMYGSTTW